MFGDIDLFDLDFARCRGTNYPECVYCLRRTTPPAQYYQSYIAPPVLRPCQYLLKDGNKDAHKSETQIRRGN